MVAGAPLAAADQLRLLGGTLAAVDFVAATLLHRRERVVEPLFGCRGDLYAQWVGGALVAWGVLQTGVAARPDRASARRLALLRGVLVAGDLAVVVGRDHAIGRRRALYAAATVVNGAASFAALTLARRLP